jgi:hypothetical protein
MSKPDAPTPPNPYQTAAAQTGTNVATGVANAFLNNINQNTPQGSLNYDVTGSYGWTDPSTGQTYQIPRFTSTQSLNATQQGLQNTSDATKQALGNIGLSQAQKVGGILGTPFTPGSGAPGAGNAAGILGAPQAQTSYNTGGAIQNSLGNYGQQQSTFGDTQQGPQYGFDGAGPIQSQFGDAGNIQNALGNSGAITRSYGPTDNFSADRSRVEGALYDRLNPQLAKDRSAIEQRLADQGIRYGSQAYTSAMDDYNRQSNDARLAVTAQGGQEQQRMMDMAAQRAGFENSAQMQAYNQQLGAGNFANSAQQQLYAQQQGRGQFANQAQQQQFGQNQALGTFANQAQQQDYLQQQGRGEFANAAQAQNYNQALGAGSFTNAAQAQQNSQNAAQAGFYNAGAAQQLGQQQSGFNAQNAARNQYMQEQYQQRNQPLNEISALMSGSQVQQPNWLNSPTSQIATTDIGGLINQNFAQQQQNYQTANANWQSTMGGLLGLGGKLAMMSDERVKENIVPMGTVFAAGEDGKRKQLPISEWSYKGDPARHVGPMAQDVERIDKSAVTTREGIKHIYPAKVMGSILRAA